MLLPVGLAGALAGAVGAAIDAGLLWSTVSTAAVMSSGCLAKNTSPSTRSKIDPVAGLRAELDARARVRPEVVDQAGCVGAPALEAKMCGRLSPSGR